MATTTAAITLTSDLLSNNISVSAETTLFKTKSDSTKTKATSYKPSTKTTIRKKIIKDERTKRQARLYKLSKQNQIDTLTSLGVTPAVIKTLKYEEDRVRQIEKLYDENK